MSVKPALQVQSRVNGLVVALPNVKGIDGLAKHFKTKGDNELVFADVKTTGRRRNAAGSMQIGSPAEEGNEPASKPRGRRAAGTAAEDLV